MSYFILFADASNQGFSVNRIFYETTVGSKLKTRQPIVRPKALPTRS
jgi:hypothetical protein